MRVPKYFNLRSDPFERGDESHMFYARWFNDQNFLRMLAQQVIDRWLDTFRSFPPRERAANFSIEKAIDKLSHKI